MRKRSIYPRLFVIFLMGFVYSFHISNASEGKMATWLWNPWMLVKESDQIIANLMKEHVTVLYLQIDADLEPKYYKAFIEKATQKQIKVYALDGSAQWVSEQGETKQQAFFTWLQQYQKTSTANERFQGVHLDVEPYLNEGWDSNRAETIARYQQFVVQSKQWAGQQKLPLALDIPFWFDEISYANQFGKGVLSEWIIRSTDSVTIMAYRNTAEAILEISSSELRYAATQKKKVMIAVETLQSSEGESVSFYTKNRAYMNRELQKVKASANAKSFEGIAVHYYNSWIQLK